MTFEDWYDRKTFLERDFLRQCHLNSIVPGKPYQTLEEYLRSVYVDESEPEKKVYMPCQMCGDESPNGICDYHYEKGE